MSKYLYHCNINRNLPLFKKLFTFTLLLTFTYKVRLTHCFRNSISPSPCFPCVVSILNQVPITQRFRLLSSIKTIYFLEIIVCYHGPVILYPFTNLSLHYTSFDKIFLLRSLSKFYLTCHYYEFPFFLRLWT